MVSLSRSGACWSLNFGIPPSKRIANEQWLTEIVLGAREIPGVRTIKKECGVITIAIEEIADSQIVPDAAHFLFDEIVAIATSMDFDSCAYKIQMPVPVSAPVVITFDSATQKQPLLHRKTHKGIDTEVRIATIKTDTRQDAATASDTGLSLQCKQIAGSPLQRKWIHVAFAPSGALGELTLTQRANRPYSSDADISEATINWLAKYVHNEMAKLLVPKYVLEAAAELTAREKEVLLWTAEGKTAVEIAQILFVSSNTVMFHLKNVVTKLGASNKTQAAVKAAALGLLR